MAKDRVVTFEVRLVITLDEDCKEDPGDLFHEAMGTAQNALNDEFPSGLGMPHVEFSYDEADTEEKRETMTTVNDSEDVRLNRRIRMALLAMMNAFDIGQQAGDTSAIGLGRKVLRELGYVRVAHSWQLAEERTEAVMEEFTIVFRTSQAKEGYKPGVSIENVRKALRNWWPDAEVTVAVAGNQVSGGGSNEKDTKL